MDTFGNILDDTVVFSCIDIMLQTNNAIHLGRDPSLLLCGSTLCGQVMAAFGQFIALASGGLRLLPSLP
jgi:hypothetical protein